MRLIFKLITAAINDYQFYYNEYSLSISSTNVLQHKQQWLEDNNLEH